MSFPELKRRAELARAGLVLPADSGTGDPWAPFLNSGYSHRRVFDVVGPALRLHRGRPLSELVEDNPWASGNPESLWNTVAAVPACGWRKIFDRSHRPVPVRGTNATYVSQTLPALLKAGPEAGGWRRVKHPYVFDLVGHALGWRTLVAAHTLAFMQELQYPGSGYPFLRMRQWLAKAAVCLRYGLPFFDGDLDPVSAFRLKPSGIRVIAANGIKHPVTEIPVSGPQSMTPFTDTGAVCVGIGCEGLPSGFRNGTGRWSAATRWCCMPSSAVILGWELADVLTHMPVLRHRDAYAVHVQDLMPAETFTEVVAASGGPGSGMTLAEFLDSETLKRWQDITPPIPGPDMLCIGQDQDIGFLRPRGERPKGNLNPKIKAHVPWINWEAGTGEIRSLIEKAARFHENGTRIRERSRILKPQVRTRSWKKLNAAAKRLRSLDRRHRKLAAEGWLTEARDAAKTAEKLRREITEKTYPDPAPEKEVPRSLVGAGPVQGRKVHEVREPGDAPGPPLHNQQRPEPASQV